MDKHLEAELKLKLHIDYPDLEDCYVDGYACSLAGLDETLNPYASDSIEGEYWTDGWWDGFYEEKAAFTLSGPITEKSQPHPEEHNFSKTLIRMLEISGIIAVSALVGYQIWDLVA